MSLDNLGKKLVKEFKRSPAKSALLVAMIPVALYCCAPLVMKSILKAPPPMVPTNSAPNVVNNSVSETSSSTNMASSKPNAPTWEMLEKWRNVDRLAKAAELTEEYRNPFEFVVTKQPSAPVEPAPTVAPLAKAKPVLDASQLPLELQATLVGGRVRRATINGRIFREGQKIRIDGTPIEAKDKPEPGMFLVLEEIQPTSVTLTYGEQTIDISIKSSNQLGAGQIVTKRDAN